MFVFNFGVESLEQSVSAAPARSDPLDFPSEKKFSFIFLTHEKGLGHMFQK